MEKKHTVRIESPGLTYGHIIESEDDLAIFKSVLDKVLHNAKEAVKVEITEEPLIQITL